MKLVVIKGNVKEALSAIECAKSETTNLPILKNVLLEGRQNEIAFTATNLEVAVRYAISGKIIEEGRGTVPLHTLSQVIVNLQSERLNVEKRGNDLLITTDNYEATLKGLPADEFPLVPKIKNQKEYIRLKSRVLKEAIAQVIAASQTSEFRPELNNMLFSHHLDAVRVVATDSFRLAEKTIPQNQFETTHRDKFQLLIPLKTSHDLLRVLKDDETVQIYHDENQILFKTDQWEFTSRLSEGNFPDYHAVVPKEFSSEVVVERHELMSAVRLAGIFGAHSSEVKVRVPEHKKGIEIFSADHALGENSTMLSAKVRGAVREVGFNWRHLLDGLKALEGKEVYFGINEEKPGLLKNQGGGLYFYVVVPNLKA